MDEQLTQKINEAAKEFSDALGDSYQALTTRTASTQKQVAQLTQAFFEGVIEHLRAQAQGNQEMVQELDDQQQQQQQQQQQREATQALAQETSVEDYMRLLDYMCSYYR